MYECRILFPDHGWRAIRLEIELGREDLARRGGHDGCLRAPDRAGRGRS